MKRVLTAVVLIPLVLLVVFRAPLWLFAVVVALIAVLALYEYLNIARAYDTKPLAWLTYGFALLLILGALASAEVQFSFSHPWVTLLFYQWTILLSVSLIFGIPVVFRRELRMALVDSAVSAFGPFYIAVPLATLIFLRRDPSSGVLLLFVLVSVWAGDTAAFYVGRSIGRRLLAPVVSPQKTWEGAVASVITSVAVSLLVFHFDESISRVFPKQELDFYTPVDGPTHWSVVHLVILGILTNIAAQLGDLFESALKRGAQMKDSGSLLPGHGGILDRIDALLFAIPAVCYYASFRSYFS